MTPLNDGTPLRPAGHAERAAPVLVVGTGLAGLSAALALAAQDVEVILAGREPSPETRAADTRSTALFGPSLDLMRAIGAGDAINRIGVPLVGLRLIDDTDGPVRAPDVLFEPHEIGCPIFGLNFENADLLSTLCDAANRSSRIRWLRTVMTGLTPAADDVSAEFADGTALRAGLVVAADGAGSPCRAAARITTHDWSYPQTAIATRFGHARPHNGVSTELHRRPGPMTTVPLAGDNSSLVWVETPAEATRLMALDDAAFRAELQLRLGGLAGRIESVGPRAAFPLTGVSAGQLGQNRVALVGEAGHRLPPIGAQGLNMGLRDVAWLADLVADAMVRGEDPGAPALLQAYHRQRSMDVATRTGAVDLLNRSLIAGLPPVDLARGAGLWALKSFSPLRRLVMREGMAPSGELPRLMQPAP